MTTTLPNRRPFPQSIEEFDGDNRIIFYESENKYILEDKDGSEWEYSTSLNKWIPSLNESLIQQQQAAYSIPGVNENEDVQTELRKRKKAEESDRGNSKRQKPSAQERKNSAVYVTSLPLDTDIDEIQSVFSKCGVIAEEIESGQARIKLYTDENGKQKGDALVIYFRPESVQLAIQMLDDTDFRFGVTNPNGNMRVKEADFSYKKNKDTPTTQNPKDKTKVIRKVQKMNNKLADWSDDDTTTVQAITKWDKTVVLKHMFTLQELEEDPAALLDIKEEVREECEKFGEVTNVILYDKELDGVLIVRFKNVDSAQACVKALNGRNFGGQAVTAYISNGSERFKKSKEKSNNINDAEEEENQRLDEFGAWLEQEN